MISSFNESTMTDHEFSAWLFRHGWKGQSNQVKTGRFGIIEYFKTVNSVKILLAKVACDNRLSTRRIFINPTMEE